MDGHHFDRLTRQITASLSRRRLGGALAVAGLGYAWRDSAEVAAGRNKKKKGKKKKKCNKGNAKCGNTCVNLKTDALHCGGCNTPCAGGTLCQGGVCLPCSPDCANKVCGAPDGCGGACATGSCAAGQACVAGQCQVACTGPTVNCSGICVNTETSAQHCGGCGHDCGASRTCVSGVCTCSPPCDVRETCCPGGCRDLRGCSPNTTGSCNFGECGTCGTVCGPGLFCCNNSTQLDPPPGTIGFCSDLFPTGFCPLP